MKNLIKTLSLKLAPIKTVLHNFNLKREANTSKYTMTNRLLVLLFPIFIVSMAEINQGKYPSKFILFLVDKPMIMLFNVLMCSLIFYAIMLIVKRGWLSMFIVGFIYFFLSIVELFKFGTNGNHLILTDMKLAKSVKSLTSFAYIKITPMLVIYTLIVLTYLVAAFWFNPKFKPVKLAKRLSLAAVSIGSCLAIVLVPAISMPVYSFFDIDTTEASNTFKLNEKFDNNSFLAFFVQTTSESVSNILKEPENYNEQSVDAYLENDAETPATSDFKKPNVIVIMSEAFADFRKYDQINLDTDAYDGWDSVASEGYKGTTIVPTFASFTVRTEFELNFGLPVKSLNDPNMPPRLLLEREQPTIAREYKNMGYSTAYIHPFLSSFYGRDKKYRYFDFDKMIFQDDFTVDVNYFTTYISDETVFNQVEQLITTTDEPMFIHTTTMQNHQPYNIGEDPDAELDNYLAGIKCTSDSLKKFTEDLKKIDEPTVIMMVGDHFPSLKGENSVYDQLELNGDNCSSVYEQSFIIWSNYDLDYDKMPDEEFSTFYMPYVMMDLIGAPKSEFSNEMLNKMETLPIYSTNYDADIQRDEELDVLTYDRVLGNIMSDEELKDTDE